MKRLFLALPFAGEEPIERLSQALLAHPLVNRVLWLSQIEVISPPFGIEPIKVDSFFAGETIQRLCETCADDYLLLFFPGSLVEFGERALERMVQAADDSGAGIVYSDFRERRDNEVIDHPLIDYQLGSLRDTFNFGSIALIARHASDLALHRYGKVPS